MHRMLSFSLFLGLLSTGAALADEMAPNASRAFQIARRVAVMENQKDLPSRAVWLSNRVVRNSRSIAFHEDQMPETSVKKTAKTSEN